MDHPDMGTQRQRPARLTDDALAKLREVSTATLTTQLLKRGFRNTFMRDVRPLRPDLRMVGYALTLRYIPAREDLDQIATIDNLTNAQRLAVESIEDGDVLVVDARGELGAAVLGEILAARVQRRGAAGLVTDGAFRDSPQIARMEMPSYARAAHATASTTLHHPVDVDVPIGCGGVMVQPGDVLVGDAEGVVVLPIGVAEEVARHAFDQEQLESYLLRRVQEGAGIRGIYPPDEQTLRDYEQWRTGSTPTA